MLFRGVFRATALTVPAFLGGLLLALPRKAAADENGTEFFEKRVRPVLVERCYQCHSAQAKKLKGIALLKSATRKSQWKSLRGGSL